MSGQPDKFFRLQSICWTLSWVSMAASVVGLILGFFSWHPEVVQTSWQVQLRLSPEAF